MGRLCTLIVIIPMLAGCARVEKHSEIRAVLDTQVAAWNAGDLDGFMSHYWKSDDLIFTTPDGENRGWQAVYDRYKRTYPTPEKMGRLRFEKLEIARLGEERAEVSGRFRLERSDDSPAGRFYLKLRRIDGTWVIVRDHTVAE